MQHLPSEILCKIARLSAGIFKDQPQAFVACRDIVCCLSRAWRAAALGDPLLWSHLYVSPRVDLPLTMLRVARLKMGATLYIIIEDDLDRSDSFFQWFEANTSPVLDRCTDVSVVSPFIWPSIAIMDCLSRCRGTSVARLHLDIRPPHVATQFSGAIVPLPFQSLMPSLVSFSMRRHFLLWESTPVYHRLQELRIFTIPRAYTPALQTMLDVFAAASCLVRLYLREFVCFGDPASPARTLPVLPNLTHLAIAGLTDSTIGMFEYVRMPALRTFHIDFGQEIPSNNLFLAWHPFLSRITSAIVSIDTYDSDFVGRFLSRMHRLHRLDLRRNDQEITFAFMLLMKQHPHSLPRLVEVLLATPQRQETIADIFLNPLGPRLPTCRFILPSAWRRGAPSVVHFRTDPGRPAMSSAPLLVELDYWSD